jgi:hypothetical protein
MLRQTWETILEDKVHEYENQETVQGQQRNRRAPPNSSNRVHSKQSDGKSHIGHYRGSIQVTHKTYWKDYTKRILWYSGCSHQKKPREFYITSSIGMKPPKIAIDNGVVIYTELPITLDDKVDKLQINYDYQQHMEEHQLSFEDWMERSNLNRLIHMGDEPYEIDDPWILKTLTGDWTPRLFRSKLDDGSTCQQN